MLFACFTLTSHNRQSRVDLSIVAFPVPRGSPTELVVFAVAFLLRLYRDQKAVCAGDHSLTAVSKYGRALLSARSKAGNHLNGGSPHQTKADTHRHGSRLLNQALLSLEFQSKRKPHSAQERLAPMRSLEAPIESDCPTELAHREVRFEQLRNGNEIFRGHTLALY